LRRNKEVKPGRYILEEDYNPFEEKYKLIEDFKVKVNNLLWLNLPNDITIGEAEELACEIYEAYEKKAKEICKRKEMIDKHLYKEREGIGINER
jgi:hypothetical protein